MRPPRRFDNGKPRAAIQRSLSDHRRTHHPGDRPRWARAPRRSHCWCWRQAGSSRAASMKTLRSEEASTPAVLACSGGITDRFEAPQPLRWGLFNALRANVAAWSRTTACHQGRCGPRHGASNTGSFHCCLSRTRVSCFETSAATLNRPSSALAWRRVRARANDFRLRIDRKAGAAISKAGLFAGGV